MAGETLHEPREALSTHTLTLHRAIVSVIEELEAVNWYLQRADACEEAGLKSILLHNLEEEIEHAAMALEWLRRADPRFHKQLRSYLFTEGDIVGLEDVPAAPEPAPRFRNGATIGSLK